MDLKPDARRVLKLAKAARTPSADDKARVERKLAAALGVAAATGAAMSAGEALAHSAAVAKPAASSLYLWITGALLGGAVATGYVLHSSAPTAEPVPAPASRVMTAAKPVPAVTTTPPAPTEVRSHEPHAPRPAHGHARAQATPTADELALLQRAQLAWREGAAQRALGLLARHRRVYPASQLTLERDALRILALCQLGQRGEARPLARALFARTPEAPMRAAIEQSCALK